MALLRGVRDSVGPAILFPLQLSDEVRGVSGFESPSRETKAFANEFEFGREHVLLLYELA